MATWGKKIFPVLACLGQGFRVIVTTSPLTPFYYLQERNHYHHYQHKDYC